MSHYDIKKLHNLKWMNLNKKFSSESDFCEDGEAGFSYDDSSVKSMYTCERASVPLLCSLLDLLIDFL